jgi:hypothetical protein
MDSLERLGDQTHDFEKLQRIIREGKELYILVSHNRLSADHLNENWAVQTDPNDACIPDKVVKRVLHARIRYANGIFRHFGKYDLSPCLWIFNLP